MSDVEIGEAQISYSHCALAKIEPDGHVAICDPINGEAAFEGEPNGVQLLFIISALPDEAIARIKDNAATLIDKCVQANFLNNLSVTSKRQEGSSPIIEINLTMRPGTDIDSLMRSAADAYYKMREELLPQHDRDQNIFRRLFKLVSRSSTPQP